jgi:hypothetical protein
MTASINSSPVYREQGLLSYTVVVIGGQLRQRARDGPARLMDGSQVVLRQRRMPQQPQPVGIDQVEQV